MSQELWICKASLYELLAQTYLYTTYTLVEALTSGEYADALIEILELNNIAVSSSEITAFLGDYQSRENEVVLHELRREYTRLFIGRTDPIVTPYGGSWYALIRGEKPLLFVGKESMAVERFMRRCGVGHPKGTNEPLDHIASELEFLQFLCLVKAEMAIPVEGAELLESDYDSFYKRHFRWLAECFANATRKECQIPFFSIGAKVLQALPQRPNSS